MVSTVPILILECLHAIAAVVLCLVRGFVRLLHKGGEVGLILPRGGDTDAHGDLKRRVVLEHRNCPHAVAEPLGHFKSLLQVSVRQSDREFLVAAPCEDVNFSQGRLA